MKGITVLYEDDNFFVLNTPSGLPVQGGAGVGSSLDALLAAAYEQPPLLVHRLDKDTSGVIVTAKNRESAAACSDFFSNPRRGLKKIYLSVCAGLLEKKGTITEKLFVKGREQSAETSFKLLGARRDLPLVGAAVDLSLAELELATGRMHQIRIHLADKGHPIPGDDKYGDFALNKQLKKTYGLKRLLLHAFSLYLPPALVKGGLEVSAPPPDHFRLFTEQSGLASTLQDRGGG
jgi:23S rRNA pseudouridine955/2504/2580 synthase